MKEYEEFIARAKEASPRPDLWRELRQLYVDNGTLQVLVLMILQMREDMMETLSGAHMVNQESIYKAIGQQGQVAGVDIILHSIFEAMREPEDDQQVSTEQRASSP